MPDLDLHPASPYRHQRIEVPAPPARTRRWLVLTGVVVATGLAQTPRLVPASIAHPVDPRGVPVALHVLRFEDDEVEPLRGVVAFAPGPLGEPWAVRADGSAFELRRVLETPRNVAPLAGPVEPAPWRNGPVAIEGTLVLHGGTSCLRTEGQGLACLPGPSALTAREGAAVRASCEHPSEGWRCGEGNVSCRRTVDGGVMCRDHLANGRVNRRQRPRPIASALRFLSLAASGDITCAVTSTRHVACWGPAVRSIEGPARVASLSMREREACALTTDGLVWCWDPRPDGGPAHRVLAPVASAIVADATATCALATDGGVWCWGVIGRAWPGHPRAMRAERPLDVRLPDAAVSLAAASADVLCARLRSGETRCWGGIADHWSEGRETERLGDTPEDDTWPVVALPPPGPRAWLLDDRRVAVHDVRFVREMAVLGDLPPAQQVVDGTAHSCALARDGVAWCWDSNEQGQLGLGDALPDDAWRPVMIARRSP